MLLSLAKILIFAGIFLIFIGILFYFSPKIPFFGKLPGDVYIKRGNFTFFAPITSFLILSLIFSIIFRLIFKFLKW